MPESRQSLVLNENGFIFCSNDKISHVTPTVTYGGTDAVPPPKKTFWPDHSVSGTFGPGRQPANSWEARLVLLPHQYQVPQGGWVEG